MPVTKQTIAIIGSGGNVGSAIAKRVAGGNYRLLLFDQNRDERLALTEEMEQLFDDADITSMNCARDCSWEADIIIMAVPHSAQKELADKIRDVAAQKIVISMANPSGEDVSGPISDSGTSAAEELQRWLPHSKVVKAFNTAFAADFGRPFIGGQQVDAFLAGDDGEAVETAAELVETAGFNPVIAGELSVSGTLERMQLLLMQLAIKYEYNRPAGWKVLHN